MKRTKTINGAKFHINEDGFVSSTTEGALGHIEDCERFAAMVWDLFELTETDDSDLLSEVK